MAFGNWQSFLDKTLKRSKADGVFNKFASLENRKERVMLMNEEKIVSSEKWINDFFDKQNKHVNQSRKCHQKAEDLRLEGNHLFQKRSFSKALLLYNRCIRFAPWPTKDDDTRGNKQLSLGIANRSAVLFHQKMYHACVKDVDRAIALGYPPCNSHKLMMRKAQAYFFLGYPEKAKYGVDELQKHLEIYPLDDPQNASKQKDIKSLLSKIRERDPKPKHASLVRRDDELPSVVKGPGACLVQASSAVVHNWNEAKGRHLVTSQALKAGDVVIVEKPYAAVLLPSHYESHCHHCFSALCSPLPCQMCTEVLYCSEVCRDRSRSSYHDIECSYLPLLHSVGIAHLALRIVITAGLQHLLNFDNTDKGYPGERAGLTDNCTYERNYLSVYALMPHDGDIPQDDLFQYSLTAALLQRCLQHRSFMGQSDVKSTSASDCSNTTHEWTGHTSSVSSVEKSPDLTQLNLKVILDHVGGLLLRHICQLVCNAHAITELQVSQTDDSSLVDVQNQVRVATAIYPTASLMNHSCDPSIISSFQKDNLVVRLVKDLQPGNEIFNCYGPHCKRMSRAERQQVLLDQYFFNCTCSACEKDSQQQTVSTSYRCCECTGPILPGGSTGLLHCSNCGREMEATPLLQMAEKAKQHFITGLYCLENNNPKGAIKDLKTCVALRETALFKHNKDLAESRDALARCYAIIGHFQEAAVLVESTLPHTRYVYGDLSIELANEFQKYAEILVNAGKLTKACSVIDNAVEIFTLNYGRHCKSVEELMEMRAEVDRILTIK